jgi:hypothetical protein
MLTKFVFSSIVLSASLLAACGSGNSPDAPVDLLASPSSITVKGPPKVCASGIGPTVYIFGGSPPYNLRNTVPQIVSLDTNYLPGAGAGFTVTFHGVCMDNLPIIVTDQDGRVLNVPLTNVEGAPPQ